MKRNRPRGLEEPSRTNPGTLSRTEHTSILFTFLPLTSSPRSAVGFAPHAYQSARHCRHSLIKTHVLRPDYMISSFFSVPPQWEPPGLQSVHHYGTTALLYRASRRVLNTARFHPSGVRSICVTASLCSHHTGQIRDQISGTGCSTYLHQGQAVLFRSFKSYLQSN